MNAVVDEASVRPVPRVRTRPADRLAALGGTPAVFIVAGLVGLAAAVDSAGARPFTSLRWAVVSTALCGAAACSRRWSLPRWQMAAWAILLGAMALGAAAGPDPITAWLGHPQRHLGVFAWVVFAVAAGTGSTLLRRRMAERTLEVAVVVVAGNVVATSIADRLGWDPAGATFVGGRIGGVFGQPVVLASVAVLLLPIVVGARRVGGVRWPIAAGLLGTIALTQTRGAVVGLVAVAAVTAPTWWTAFWRRGSWIRVAVTVGVGVVAVAVAALSPLGDRLTDSLDSSRPDEWRIGLAVLAEHPLVGVGPEGYRIEVLGHLDDGYVDRHGRDVVVDRAHSAPLDVAVSGGAVAAVAYVALVGAVAVATWRRQRRSVLDVSGRVAVAAGAGAVGVFAAGLVAFPVPEVDAVAWLFAGVALGTTTMDLRGKGNDRRSSVLSALAAPERSGATRVVVWGGRAVASGALTVAVLAGVTDVIADHRMGNALTAAADGRTEPAVRSAERALDLRPDLIDAHFVAATVAATGPTILDVDRAIDFTAAGLDRFPDDPALRDLEVRLLVDRAVRSGLADDVAAATAATDALHADDPTSLVAQSGTERLVAACLIRCENKP